ncbi:MAG TPA: recombinase family protein [Symbiobacteriaceae bacterium]
MVRTALYGRVSTDEQVEGYSIGAQVKAMEEYAARQGWAVVAHYIDEGESARTDNRPQFQRMVSAAKRKPRPFDVILVHKFDRFARNREDSSIYKSLFRKECGVDVRSVTELTDSSPSGKLLEGVLEVVAEFYSNNLAHEVLKGQRERALAAGAMSVPPIGYKTGPDGRYQVDLATADLVRWLFAEYAKGEEGYRSLAQRVRADGETKFGPVVRNYSWIDAFIRRILANEVYCGTYIWGRHDSNRKWTERDRSEWVVVEDAHEPLVSKELFERVQQLRSSRRGVRRAQPGEDYLLRGLVRCLDCGANAIKFRYQWDDKRTGQRIVVPCLICGAYSKNKGCYCNRVEMAEVEGAVLAYLKDFLQNRIDPSHVEVKLTRPSTAHKEIEMIDRRLSALDKKLQRLVDAYAAEVISLDDLATGRERIAAERSTLEQQKAALDEAAFSMSPEAMATAVRERAKAVQDTATDYEQSIAQRRAALAQIVDSVHVSRKQDLVKIVFRL